MHTSSVCVGMWVYMAVYPYRISTLLQHYCVIILYCTVLCCNNLYLGERSEPHTGVFNRDFA